MLDFFEIQLSFIYILIVYVIAVQVKKKRIVTNPLYKWFIPGLMVRIFGGLALCLIYLFYYKGGDTVNYYKGSICMINLLFTNFPVYLDIMMGNLTFENYMAFSSDTGFPPTYMYRDDKTFAVIRYSNLLVLLCAKKFIPTTIILASLAYSGPWRLFLVFCREFPGLSKQLALAILFMPSVFFWGSGLLKDTFTFSAICWYTFSFYKVFIVKEKRFLNSIYILISLWILVAIKPYLFIAVFPGSIMWFIFYRLKNVRNALLRIIYFPVVAIGGLIIAFGFVSLMGSQMGKYRLDTLKDVAIITQDDLSRDTYGPNSFDIGELDGSNSGFIAKAPLAISATLFRPFIWEVNNPAMFLSAAENLIIMILFIMMLVKIRPFAIIKITFSQPIIFFSILYSLILAFSVGISTANFGALVRYKIPLMPFFASALLIIQYYHKYGDDREIIKELSAS